MLVAAELRRRDVDCLLIDAHDAPLGWDRATVVHERSIEVFESLGLVDRFLDQAGCGFRRHVREQPGDDGTAGANGT
jgi:2-polyprenyl-6-methoxyphenol hydroxylase-like FAD-dependent oxidoreductase